MALDTHVKELLDALTPGCTIQMTIKTFSFFLKFIGASKIDTDFLIITERNVLNTGHYASLNGCRVLVGHRYPLKCGPDDEFIYVVDINNDITRTCNVRSIVAQNE